MARFYVDADIGRVAVNSLSRAGHDVEYSIDAGFGQEPDPFHLRHASAENRILVSMNAQDFRTLHRLWKTLVHWGLMAAPHAGIVTASRRTSEETLASAITLLLTLETHFIGRFFTWQVETGVWHEDKF